MSNIRKLYRTAPLVKEDAKQLEQIMMLVDTGKAAPVLVCYKGATTMIDAKYSINPFVKFDDFNKGKELINKAVKRDTLNLEMRFIRYSIQSNLPGFLGYHGDIPNDKHFLIVNTKNSKDPQLKEMIVTYLSAQETIKPEELKQLKN